MKVAVFNNPVTGIAAIVSPAPKVDIVAAAKKAVPTGVDFWLVDASEIPTDRALRDAWVWESESAASGVGE